MLRELILSLYQ